MERYEVENVDGIADGLVDVFGILLGLGGPNYTARATDLETGESAYGSGSAPEEARGNALKSLHGEEQE